jgi:hypothetical protein
MSITPARQRNAVSEGLALGLLMCGVNHLDRRDKVAIDIRMECAWSNWPYRHRFPQVDTDLGNGLDGVHVATRADARKHVFNLYWEAGRAAWFVCARGNWDDEVIDPQRVASSIDGKVPATGWKALAEEFLRDFPAHDDSESAGSSN